MVSSLAQEIERCVREQYRCKEYLELHPGDPGASLGLFDWIAEEAILRRRVANLRPAEVCSNTTSSEINNLGGCTMLSPVLHTQEVTGSSPVAPTTFQQLTKKSPRLTGCKNGERRANVQPGRSQARRMCLEDEAEYLAQAGYGVPEIASLTSASQFAVRLALGRRGLGGTLMVRKYKPVIKEPEYAGDAGLNRGRIFRGGMPYPVPYAGDNQPPEPGPVRIWRRQADGTMKEVTR